MGAQRAYLQEAARHMISEHGQAGPAVAGHLHAVGRHDDGLLAARHQDDDAAVAEGEGEDCHAEDQSEGFRFIYLR